MIARVLPLVAGCVLLETAEQTLYRLAGQAKRGQPWHSPGYWARVGPAVLIHLTRLGLWYLLLKSIALGLAMPLLGINFLMIALVGRFFFGERVDRRRWLGTVLVMAGFILVAGRLQ